MNIGSLNRLTVVRDSPHGLYLTDGESDVLLPRKVVPPQTEIGDELEVFVLTDSEDRPIATTQKPKGMVGELVPLTAKQVVRAGAFMDWGLDKDLLVPFSEQHRRMQPGETYLVLLLLDSATNRVYGTTRLAEHLSSLHGSTPDLQLGRQVAIQIADVGRDAVRVVADGRIFATIFADEMFGPFTVGDIRTGYVKQIREDGRIAISLSPQGMRGVEAFEDILFRRLEDAGGFLPYSDATSPEVLRAEFGVSKSTFKKAIGGLFRSEKIDIGKSGIRIRR